MLDDVHNNHNQIHIHKNEKKKNNVVHNIIMKEMPERIINFVNTNY